MKDDVDSQSLPELMRVPLRAFTAGDYATSELWLARLTWQPAPRTASCDSKGST